MIIDSKSLHRFALLSQFLSVALVVSLLPDFAMGKATTVTLAELVKQSEVVVYGQVQPPSESPSATLLFDSILTLKGDSLVGGGAIKLCNSRPNQEWPDLSKVTGHLVLFLSKKGNCFDASHSYRSVIEVRDDRALTVVIKDQPEDQPLDGFLQSVRCLLSKEKGS